MKNEISKQKIFGESADIHMKEFNMFSFMQTHPSLYKAIMRSMDEYHIQKIKKSRFFLNKQGEVELYDKNPINKTVKDLLTEAKERDEKVESLTKQLEKYKDALQNIHNYVTRGDFKKDELQYNVLKELSSLEQSQAENESSQSSVDTTKWYLVKCPGATPSGLAIARLDNEVVDPEEDGPPEWITEIEDQHIHDKVTHFYPNPLTDITP